MSDIERPHQQHQRVAPHAQQLRFGAAVAPRALLYAPSVAAHFLSPTACTTACTTACSTGHFNLSMVQCFGGNDPYVNLGCYFKMFPKVRYTRHRNRSKNIFV